jgi:hypothetical protein
LSQSFGGIKVARDRIIDILEDLGFVVEDHGTLHVVPPQLAPMNVDGPADWWKKWCASTA